MKKFLLILFILISTISFSQEFDLFTGKIDAFCYKKGDSSFTDWEPSNMSVSIDPNKKRLIIYSPKVQIIDYVKFNKVIQDGKTILTSQATDSNYNSVLLKIISDEKYLYIVLIYNDLVLMYRS